MPYSGEARRLIRKRSGGVCEISGEYVDRQGEAHSSTRLHLRHVGYRAVGTIIGANRLKQKELVKNSKPIDGIYLSKKVHTLLHNVANNRERKLTGAYTASPKIVHETTYDSINLNAYSYALDQLSEINKLPETRRSTLIDALRSKLDSMYTIPGKIGRTIHECVSENGSIKPAIEEYKNLTNPDNIKV